MSCGRDFYVPNPANLLVLENKKDFKANVSINSAQVAYSPLSGLGLKGDFGYVRSRNSFGERNLNIGTIGIGYYGSKKVEPLFKGMHKSMRRPQTPSIGFDIFANASLGSINTNNNTSFQLLNFQNPNMLANSFSADIYKPHVSGQVFWKSKTFTLNLGLRYSLINFFNGVAFGEFDEQELARASRFINVTPASNIEWDLKLSNGNDQVASFVAISWTQRTALFESINSSFAFGLDVNISSLYRERKANADANESKPVKKNKSKRKKWKR